MNGITRRQLSAAALGLLASHFTHPLGAELYTVRNILPTAADQTLKSIAAIGYREVELDRATLLRIAPMLKQYGLKPVACHIETPLITGDWKPWVARAAQQKTPYLSEGAKTLQQAMDEVKKLGVNTVVVDSTDNYAAMLGNLAFSLSLYSGQMCTTPQNFYLPRGGIETDAGHKSPADFGADLTAAIDKLLSDPARAAGTLGAIVNDDVLARIDKAASLGTVVRESAPVEVPDFTDATARTPLIVAVDDAAEDAYGHEHFGPISFVITTADTERSLERLRTTIRTRGALTASVYSTSDSVLDAAERAAIDAGVNISANLTGAVFVNQTAAFSDYHGTGANPAATASLVDPAFVSGRFFFVETRRHA